jgi:hypothetical protein
MKMRNIAILFLLSLFGHDSLAQTAQPPDTTRVHLPNGWSLTPAGSSLALGDLPLNMAISPNKKLIAVTNNGESVQSIQLIDPVNNKLLNTVEIPKSWY